MESKDLLHPGNDENQNTEVNTGASSEAQNNATNIETEVTEVLPVELQEIMPAHQEEEKEAEVSIPERAEENTTRDEKEESSREEQPESAAQMMADIEDSQTLSIEDEIEEDDEKAGEYSIEQIEADYVGLDLEQALAAIEAVVVNPDYNQIKQRVGILKSKILQQLKACKQEQLDAFIQDGGNKDEFVPEMSDWEKRFNEALRIFKNNKNKFLEQIELERQKNLEAKQAIIEGLRELIENESNLKILNDKFKIYQEQWKEIGPVPQGESTNLWQNYHFYVEKFFDILRINKELRSLDLKKNLEQKIKLCEQAESLLLQDSINKSFKMLQQLHDEWKEIGPVPEDKKEEIWERFKNASDQINTRRREYYDKLYEGQQANYNAKVVLCEQAEELIAAELTTLKQYNSIGDQLTGLLKIWKTIGPAPAKLNDEIWNRFKTTMDKFFEAKKEFFRQLKETQMQNYNEKLNLAIQAEAIALRTDWKQATEELLGLQKSWKEIGSIPRKHSDVVWKRFRSACDRFFEAKSHYFSNIQEIEADNLQKKEDLIKRIAEHQFGDDKKENLEAIKAYQREWTELGHVPKKEKDRLYNEYREALNKRFADLKISADDVRRDSFKSKIDTILNNPNAERLLDKEKRFLVNKMNQLKEDIILWENNLGFFANSKNADILKLEFTKKIDAAKAEVKELEFKIRVMKTNPKPEPKEEAGKPATEE